MAGSGPVYGQLRPQQPAELESLRLRAKQSAQLHRSDRAGLGFDCGDGCVGVVGTTGIGPFEGPTRTDSETVETTQRRPRT